MKPIAVLSLFDGMSGGQIALERAGISVKAYYASEIDRYAIKITQKNYPNMIQLGDINCWKEWNIPVPDLILAGSPCQGFSNAGRGLNFDDPRSRLFFVFYDILAYFYGRNPKLKFLLENVKMKKEWQDVITDRMKVEPVLINSALVSAQNRERLYWCNWSVTQPDDRHIYLKDIIEHGDVDRLKSYTIDANYFKSGQPKSIGDNQFIFSHQSHKRAMVRTRYVSRDGQVVEKDRDKSPTVREAFRIKDNFSICDSTIQIGKATDISGHDYNKRIYHPDGKSPTLNAHQGGNQEPKVAMDDYHYRKLTPLECERLQTVPEGYTEGVSNTQRYRMLGNGWTIEVISHILKQADFD